MGARYGEEAPFYASLGIRHQLWIEARPDAFEVLSRNIEASETVHLANVACGPGRGTATMHVVPEQAGTSSLLEPGRPLLERVGADGVVRMEVPVVPLDDLIAELGLACDRFDLLVLDVQGYELEVLRGARRTVSQAVDHVVTEISTRRHYENGCLQSELDEAFSELGFSRLMTRFASIDHGDAFYTRRSSLRGLDRFRLGLLGPVVRHASLQRTPDPPR